MLDTQVKAVSFSPDGRYLFTGNGNSSCYQLEVGRLLGDRPRLEAMARASAALARPEAARQIASELLAAAGGC